MSNIHMHIVELVRETGFKAVDQADVDEQLESCGEDMTSEDLMQLEQ